VPGGRAATFGADRARRAAETDRWLASLLGTEAGVALVAVGGYGRRELLPGSDLDVLLLHAGRPSISGLADRIWYPIWDSGAHLDHAVRTPREGREVARADLRAALGMLHARHVAGDPALTAELRSGVLADWRAAAGTRLAELRAMHVERTERSGELAFLLEPDLKEARGGLRDAGAIHAVAAAWVAPGPGPRVRAAQEFILDTRHALHEVTGRAADRLVLQEQDEVARVLDLADADVLLRRLAGAGRSRSARARLGPHGAGPQGAGLPGAGLPGGIGRRGPPPVSAHRRPLAEGLVEQDGEVVFARSAEPTARRCRSPGPMRPAMPSPPCSAPARRRSASGRRWTRRISSPASCRTGSGCATARNAIRCTPSPWTATWSRRPPTPPR